MGTAVAPWLSGSRRWKLKGGLGFPSGRALGSYGSVWEGCCGPWVLWPCQQVCFLLAFRQSLEAGSRSGGGEGRVGTWAPNPSQALTPSPRFTNVFPLDCASRHADVSPGLEKPCWAPCPPELTLSCPRAPRGRCCSLELGSFPDLVKGMEPELVPEMRLSRTNETWKAAC